MIIDYSEFQLSHCCLLPIICHIYLQEGQHILCVYVEGLRIYHIALYGSESWAVKKCDEKRITAFELWCWRRVLRISRTEYKTNVWVRQKIGVPEQNGLLEQLNKRKLAKYGH